MHLSTRWSPALPREPIRHPSGTSKSQVVVPRLGSDLRTAAARRHMDAAASVLIDALDKASPEFRKAWAQHDVAVRRTTRKVLTHERVGRLDLECDVVISPPSGQHLVLFRGHPGSDAADRLELLRVVGTQSFLPPS